MIFIVIIITRDPDRIALVYKVDLPSLFSFFISLDASWFRAPLFFVASYTPETSTSENKPVEYLKGDVWEEIVFLKGLVKFGEIRNIKDLM